MKKRISALLIFLVAPATIIAGVLLLDDRKYYFISLLVVFYAILIFFLSFEQRKPQAREVIVVAALSAIAVAGRAAFFMIPQFKPVTAIVILAGVAFGAEAGFLVGAMTALVSNFFFGMGPFTPWQMFSFGLIGYLAGMLSNKGILSRKKSALCLFGGLSAFFIFGSIMDFSSLLLWTKELTGSLVVATLVAGLPFNLMHAGSTVFFLYIFAIPMLEKLDRITSKYGLLRRDQ
ncbi:MAG: ECF transporter S component [Firmicutes bacterium HGW-Firmicutes-11]|jgi:energy-coupling factor transport system substrate-specific component|nr:MAG: ECF transporter S component [Firmicutes bacterium HGW-Firmicutes-11]